jgi:hypothetical protein
VLSFAVCKTTIDEVEQSIATTTETHTVQVRFRIDEKKRIPYARSEYRLMQILEEETRDRFEDYGVSKATGVRCNPSLL